MGWVPISRNGLIKAFNRTDRGFLFSVVKTPLHSSMTGGYVSGNTGSPISWIAADKIEVE
jgi:hypothetical protein